MGAPIMKGLVYVHNTKTGKYLKVPLEQLPEDKRTVRHLLEYFNVTIPDGDWDAYDRSAIPVDLDRPLVPGDRIRWAKNAGNA